MKKLFRLLLTTSFILLPLINLMPPEHCNLISNLVAAHNPAVTLYRAFPHHREFNMEILPITGS